MTEEQTNEPMTATEVHETADHPMAGVATDAWSSPTTDPETVERPTARLVLKRNGVETDVEFPVNPPCVIGRFDPAVGPIDIDLGSQPEAMYVSRKHAKIVYEDGAYQLKDLGSSNGTYILHEDFERVDSAPLADGDEFALGNARFVIHIESATA